MEAMNSLRKKLRGNRGASITFALLLFLVCTMVSSVVIVAASTAGGRLSDIREMDERYYAVTAVENRLCGLFDGKSAIITYTNVEGAKTFQSQTPASGMLVGDASKAFVMGEADVRAITPLTYTSPTNSVQYTCSVQGRVANGMLVFTVVASVGTGQKPYAMYITFAPTVKTTVLDADTGLTRATVTWKLNKIEKQTAA